MARWYDDYDGFGMKEVRKMLDEQQRLSELIDPAVNRYLRDGGLGATLEEYAGQSVIASKAMAAFDEPQRALVEAFPQHVSGIDLGSTIGGYAELSALSQEAMAGWDDARRAHESAVEMLMLGRPEHIRHHANALAEQTAFARGAMDVLREAQRELELACAPPCIDAASRISLAWNAMESTGYPQSWWEEIAGAINPQVMSLSATLETVQRSYLRAVRSARVHTRKRRRADAQRVKQRAADLVNELLDRCAMPPNDSIVKIDIAGLRCRALFQRMLLTGLASRIAPLQVASIRDGNAPMVVARLTFILCQAVPGASQAFLTTSEPFCRALEMLEAIQGMTRTGGEAPAQEELQYIDTAIKAYTESLAEWRRSSPAH